jgi:hypothetical protein
VSRAKAPSRASPPASPPLARARPRGKTLGRAPLAPDRLCRCSSAPASRCAPAGAPASSRPTSCERSTAGAGLDARDEADCVLPNRPVQRDLLGAVALVVERGAVRRPLGLPAKCVQDGLPMRRAHSAPGRAPRLHRCKRCLPLFARRCEASNGCVRGSDRQLRGSQIRTADVSSGSKVPVRRQQQQSLAEHRRRMLDLPVHQAAAERPVPRCNGQPPGDPAKIRYRRPRPSAREPGPAAPIPISSLTHGRRARRSPNRWTDRQIGGS